ncbi:MAG: 4-hydroxybenzoate octaprenyltransferase [Rhodospirillaceae bacterium]|nr:MAG: 4-hydroxybenzoate octaprenyltransferase [Rhodospirillaceae bacterium]
MVGGPWAVGGGPVSRVRRMSVSSVSSMPGDIPVDHWIDRHVPARARPYLRLMRFDRPIGTWLLVLPCWWSVVLAGGARESTIIDRDIDANVARTAVRPIPSGAVTPRRAAVLLAGLLVVGLVVLLQLNTFAIGLGAASLVLVLCYPFMKRITFWPQIWLGLTFNWGALLGWAAVTGRLEAPAVALYAAGLFWTLGYDTIYAHQDKEDDMRIGVKSSALALAERTRPAVAIFYALTVALTALAGLLAGLGEGFWGGMGLTAVHLAWQVATLDINASADCLAKFRSNRLYGVLVLGAIVAGVMTR